MILSQSTEYTLRIVAFLALNSEPAPFQAREVTKEAHIPMHYSAKILRKLSKVGILRATKGHSTGYEIAQSPSKIRFIDIIEAIEDEIGGCVFEWETSSNQDPSMLRDLWEELNETFIGWARKTTLADVMKDVNAKGSRSFYREILKLDGEECQ